ncbi:MAG: hypothetical protein WKF71_01900 [Pyrinomonadaceae bacterium]
MSDKTATVADALMATSRIYTLFQNIKLEQTQEQQTEESEEKANTLTKIKTRRKAFWNRK